jgi:hypothetical protein
MNPRAGRMLRNMKSLPSLLFAALLLTFSAGSARAQEPLTCEDWRCSFQERLNTECPCAGNENHGRYVSCVAHVVNDLVKEGLPTNCKGKLKRCAARSVCGKEDRGFATCTSFEYGTCVTNPDTTTTCSHDPTIACTTDTDCLVSSQCRITRDAAGCEAAGGAVNLAPTCCSTCSTTP